MSEQNGQDDVLDVKFLWIVGGLLAVMIASLALLWLRERAARVRAEETVVLLSRDRQSVKGLLDQIGTNPVQAGGGSPVQRDDLARATVTLDGKPRTALRVSPVTGKRLGFLPGDVVIVSEGLFGDSQPATAPAETNAPRDTQ